MRASRVWLVVLVISASAHADPRRTNASDDVKAQARAHAGAGTQFFNVQAYDKAAEEYHQAYLLDPDPNYLYASAQAQRLGGDCEHALLSYKAYLRTKPDDDKALKNIERCEQDLKDHPRPEPGAHVTAPMMELPSAPVLAPADVAAPPPEMITRPWSGDWAGHALVLGGVGVAATGAVLYLGGRSTISNNNSAATYDQFAAGRAAADSAHTKETIGISAMAVGGALVVGGVLHYVLHTRPIEQSVAAVVHDGGAALVMTGAF